jgi:hypothetical protein
MMQTITFRGITPHPTSELTGRRETEQLRTTLDAKVAARRSGPTGLFGVVFSEENLRSSYFRSHLEPSS